MMSVEKEYESMTVNSLEELREDFSTGKTELVHESIETR